MAAGLNQEGYLNHSSPPLYKGRNYPMIGCLNLIIIHNHSELAFQLIKKYKWTVFIPCPYLCAPKISELERETPLSLCAYFNRIDIVKNMLDHGLQHDIKFREWNLYNALITAAVNGNADMVRLIISYLPDVIGKYNFQDREPFSKSDITHALFRAFDSDDLQTVSAILEWIPSGLLQYEDGILSDGEHHFNMSKRKIKPEIMELLNNVENLRSIPTPRVNQ